MGPSQLACQSLEGFLGNPLAQFSICRFAMMDARAAPFFVAFRNNFSGTWGLGRRRSKKAKIINNFFSPFTRAHKVCSGMGVTLLGLSWKCLNFTLSYLYRVTVPKKRGFTSSWRTHTRLNKWAYLWPLAKVEMFKSEKFSFYSDFQCVVQC